MAEAKEGMGQIKKVSRNTRAKRSKIGEMKTIIRGAALIVEQ